MSTDHLTSESLVFKVDEVFGPTIQGEGRQAGRPTVFVRLGGCDFRCSWCDTLHAVLPEHRHTWQRMSAVSIMAAVAAKSPPTLITLSGGNPALQPCNLLIASAHTLGYTVTLETQGSAYRSWFAQLDHLCLSPKPPSSGMPTDWDTLKECIFHGPVDTILKVVAMDEADLEYVGEVRALAMRQRVPLYLQVGNSWTPGQHTPVTLEEQRTLLLDRYTYLVERVLEHGWHNVIVLPQLHVLLWGNQRGV